MFDIAWSELLIVAIVAILVVGPKELPSLLRTLGQMLAKLRRSADDFRRQFDEAVREAGAEDLQREIRALQQHNPLTQVRDAIDEASRDFDRTTREAFGPELMSPLPTDPVPGAPGDNPGPPPALPPVSRDSADAAFGPVVPSASPQAAASPASASSPAPGGSAPPKETAANGSTHELRVNGEHRPAG
ncbi:MAG TPA: Sec-independent protein translocase protein TatB [Hyphomicrobiales bacterium]|jgi:sec-independent protein translocase protein TatB